MPDYSTLVSAITDVGDWRWWAENLPDSFQIEFGGVQFYEPPEDPSKPPRSTVALRFRNPSMIRFLRRGAPDDLPGDWHLQLRDDKLEPFNVSHEEFAVGGHIDPQIIASASDIIEFFSSPPAGKSIQLAFWAGPVGMHIEAEEIGIILMSGEISLERFNELHGDWWAYWKEYWKRRDTSDPMPKSYACEVTIPIKAD